MFSLAALMQNTWLLSALCHVNFASRIENFYKSQLSSVS